MQIEYEVIGDIGLITLHHPPENYLSVPDFLNLKELKKFIEDHHCKGLIFQGSGRHFSAGADIKQLYQLAETRKLNKRINKGKQILSYINGLLIPTIAAISGVCFGGGLEIALACHIIVASEKALFAFPETNHGLIPGLSGTLRLTRRIGFPNSLNMILSGDILDIERAIKMGLVDYVINPKEVREYSLNLIKKMTDQKSIKVINYVMQSIHNMKKMNFEKALIAETKLFCELALDEARKIKFK